MGSQLQRPLLRRSLQVGRQPRQHLLKQVAATIHGQHAGGAVQQGQVLVDQLDAGSQRAQGHQRQHIRQRLALLVVQDAVGQGKEEVGGASDVIGGPVPDLVVQIEAGEQTLQRVASGIGKQPPCQAQRVDVMRVEAFAVVQFTTDAVDEAIVEAGDVVPDDDTVVNIIEEIGQDRFDQGGVRHVLEANAMHLAGSRRDVPACRLDETMEQLAGRLLILIDGSGDLDDLVTADIGSCGFHIIENKSTFGEGLVAHDKALHAAPGAGGQGIRPLRYVQVDADGSIAVKGGASAQHDQATFRRQEAGLEVRRGPGLRFDCQILGENMAQNGGSGVAVHRRRMHNAQGAPRLDGFGQHIRFHDRVQEGHETHEQGDVLLAPGRPQLVQQAKKVVNRELRFRRGGRKAVHKLHKSPQMHPRQGADLGKVLRTSRQVDEADLAFLRQVAELDHRQLVNLAEGKVDGSGEILLAQRPHHLQEAHDLARDRLVEEALLTQALHRQTCLHQRLFRRFAQAVRAVQDGDIAGFVAALSGEFLNQRDQPALFLLQVVENVVKDGSVAFLLAAHRTLAIRAALVRNQALGAEQNLGRAAVADVQLDDGRAIALDIGINKLRFGAAPAVNGLVIVGHNGHAARRWGQQLQHLVLGQIDVLILIYQDVAECAAEVLARLLIGAQQKDGIADKVIEIEGAALPEPLFIGACDLRQHRIGIARRFRRVRQGAFLAAEVGNDLPWGIALAAEVFLTQDSIQGMALLILVDDGEARIDVDPRPKAPQDAYCCSVKGIDPNPACLVAQQGEQALAHLFGGAVGEGDGQDLFRPRAFLPDQPGDAMNKNAGFAAARTRQNKQGSGPEGNSLVLALIQ